LIADERGHEQRVVKGAPVAIASIAPIGPEVTAELEQLTGQGYRVLAVAGGPPQQLRLMGLIALSDPPRPDSKGLLTELRSMGVHSVMVTGDAAPTAAAVAAAIGLEGPVCPPGAIPDRVRPEDYSVYAGVFPEDKFRLVKALQRTGHTVGMCGDGANDAPALRQAQMGIAVSTATDVAKSAAYPHLHAQCAREKVPARAVFGGRSGPDGSRDIDTHADGSAADHRGFHHDVADQGPGDPVVYA
jgi:H+-transporting ATPase